jgi:uncharacterized membrane protein
MSFGYYGRPMDDDAAELDLFLRPYRSLSPTGFGVVMTILAVWSFVGGIVFLSVGAWPVIGFVGVDVALVWWAFKASYGDRRAYERLRLAQGVFTVERSDKRGAKQHHEFPSYWLKVTLEKHGEDSNRLVLSSHGRHLAVAEFLGPEQREEVATMLSEALARSRTAPTV